MVDDTTLQAALREFVGVLVRRYDIGQVLHQLTDHCVEVLGCDGAGVAVRNGGTLRFVAATDAVVTRIEQRQIAARQGPCQDAYTTGAATTSIDLDDEERWPAYRQVACEAGIRAAAGVPLIVDRTTTLGALNLSWRQVHSPTEDELGAARLLADMAAAYITNLRSLADAERLSDQLQETLDSRMVIEEAKGILEERHQLDSQAALDRLRDYAQPRNQRLSEIAREIITGDLDVETAGQRTEPAP